MKRGSPPRLAVRLCLWRNRALEPLPALPTRGLSWRAGSSYPTREEAGPGKLPRGPLPEASAGQGEGGLGRAAHPTARRSLLGRTLPPCSRPTATLHPCLPHTLPGLLLLEAFTGPSSPPG